ncbi:MAG: hypothetical protein KDD53_01155 [Bdellovibrionales bacterium]|nr:hypothetical protein [Bdellovibrionales bacterium]
MEALIKFSIVPYEEPYQFRLRFEFINNSNCFSGEIYETREGLLEAAEQFINFKSPSEKRFKWLIGDETTTNTSAAFYSIEAITLLHRGGHALCLSYHNGLNPPDLLKASLCIKTSPQEIVRFGHDLKHLGELKAESFEWKSVVS